MANVATGYKSKKQGVGSSNAFRSYHPDWMVKLHQTPSQKDDPCRFQAQNKSHKREWEHQEREEIKHQEREARERQERARRIVTAAMREIPPDTTSWSRPNCTRKGEDMELMQMRRNAARKAPSYNQYRQ